MDDKLERVGGQSLWGDGQSQVQGQCAAREAGANEISGDERLPVE